MLLKSSQLPEEGDCMQNASWERLQCPCSVFGEVVTGMGGQGHAVAILVLRPI